MSSHTIMWESTPARSMEWVMVYTLFRRITVRDSEQMTTTVSAPCFFPDWKRPCATPARLFGISSPFCFFLLLCIAKRLDGRHPSRNPCGLPGRQKHRQHRKHRGPKNPRICGNMGAFLPYIFPTFMTIGSISLPTKYPRSRPAGVPSIQSTRPAVLKCAGSAVP